MSDFHIVVFFNDYYTLIVAFLTKQIQNRYRNRRVATPLLLVGCNHMYSMRPSNWMLHRSHFTQYRICSLFLLQVHVGSEEGAVGGEKLDNDRKMEILKNRRRSRKKGVVEQ